MSLMCDHLSTLVPAFDGKGGVRTVFEMLGSNSQMIRPQSLNSCFAFLLDLSANSSDDLHSSSSLLRELARLSTLGSIQS